ncbi:unnamed protein product [Zymoseptoria tritici ST99CH_3D7]|uniref:Pectate lyase superfamily protein domain-containing protein n=2 Tax=Zymoseptoria tritici TaxID=1047171 RepID=A0A1X7RU50_ZYMT9|nr:unnamed protein product [Zymoseptoria tritici ST99CH_3D7]
MQNILTRVLALWQVPIVGHDHGATAVGSASSSYEPFSTRRIHPEYHNRRPPPKSQEWQNDRYDPYVCEALGHNGCWAPSEPGGGPPYMGPKSWPKRSKECIVPSKDDPTHDDAPAVIKAFQDCCHDGHIIFENKTYHIGSVMNTTGLKDVDIEVRGLLKWSTNIDYWLAHSMPIGFQNQTSAWHLGGEDIHFYGHGHGTLDGNGQVWYDFAKGVSNIHGRPHQITITNTKNSVIEGLRFVQSQMWTMTVARSEKVLLQDIYVSSTSTDPAIRSNVNTDGCDTVYTNDITFLRWTITNGDDSISMKQNSTNIYISNCTFYNGASLAMGSIGQYPGQIEIIENITATDIKMINTGYAGRIKTWVGKNKGFPPNGGGGGLGHAKNITFRNFELEGVGTAWLITQCTFYDGPENAREVHQEAEPDCTNSQFEISDLNWGDTHGTIRSERIAALQCSATKPCHNINIFNNSLTALDTKKPAETFLCEQVKDTCGFTCTEECNGRCPRS